MEDKYGLSQQQLAVVRGILARFADKIDRAAVFGSRASGGYRPNSDLDLVLYGDIDERTADRIWTLFAESGLPFKVDVLVYHRIEEPALRRHIDLVAADLFTKEELLEEKTRQ